MEQPRVPDSKSRKGRSQSPVESITTLAGKWGVDFFQFRKRVDQYAILRTAPVTVSSGFLEVQPVAPYWNLTPQMAFKALRQTISRSTIMVLSCGHQSE